MIDVDLISHLDVRTGLPVVDHLSPTQRWRDALNHGCGRNTSSDTLAPRKHFGSVGADTTNNTPNAAPTAAKTKTILWTRNTKHPAIQQPTLTIENTSRRETST
jgi:hypothetical protein